MCHHIDSYQKIIFWGEVIPVASPIPSVLYHTWDAKDHVSASFLRAEWSDAQDAF